MNSAQNWPNLADLSWSELIGGEIIFLVGCKVSEAHLILDRRLRRRKGAYASSTLLRCVLFRPAGYNKHDKKIVNDFSQTGDPVEKLKSI